MLTGNQMAQALIDANLASELPQTKKRKNKEFKCHKCKTAMQINEGTNTMSCTNPKCSNYYVFTTK